MKFRYLSYTFFSLVLTVAANAQTKPTQENKPSTEKKPTTNTPPEKKPSTEPAKGTLTEEIDVVRPYKPVLADAAKIRRSPDLNNYKVFKPNLSYLVLDKRLELNSDITQLQAQPLQQAAPLPFENNYAKAGIGNYSSTLGEVYLNNGPDEALQLGFFAKHLAQSGSLNKQNYSRQQAALFGKSIQEKITINGELNFDRLGSYFYGVNPEMADQNLDPRKQRFGTVGLKGELLKNYDPESTLDYAVKADAYTLSSKYNSKETSFALSGFFNGVWKQFNLGVNSSLDFTSTKDSLNIGNHIFRANPYIKFQGKNYKLSLGLNFVQEFGTEANTNLFPIATAELPLVPQYATIFGGYTGDVLKSSLRGFAFENPYLAKSIINNAVEKSNLYGGVKGNAGAGFSFKGMVYFKTIEDMPLYVNSKYGFERFELAYDKAKVVGLEGEVNVKASETLTWTGKIEANKYNMTDQAEAWLKPGLKLYSNFRLSLKKKFIIDGEVVYTGDRDAFTYDYSKGIPASIENSRVVAVKSYLDLSGGAEYLVKNKLGVFLKVNNLFGNKYQQYLYYPKLGFNVIGGLNYSF
ncbi:hypothetical protein [Desertivirga arenae]|uniref:hypothetical protein n=1 Tax=Desertivirga arenae TaxID=2810309 RepID=UPI001A965832|nr:hypothetical protein [Pedobacter sp. SYSU D00823]